MESASGSATERAYFLRLEIEAVGYCYRIRADGELIRYIRRTVDAHRHPLVSTVRFPALAPSFARVLLDLLEDHRLLHETIWSDLITTWRRWKGLVPGFRTGAASSRKATEFHGNRMLHLVRDYQAAYDRLREFAIEHKIELPSHIEPPWFIHAREDRENRGLPIWVRAEQMFFRDLHDR